TGGIGEHAAPVREMVCQKLGWLGVAFDAAANAANATRISTAPSAATVLVLPTNEEWMLARHTAKLITPG
ncbi:MAG: acetate kinase, partial [Rhodocyclaceae bacterium]|nr:acetate kinase [Rhodocyclaceae bacterium]